MILVLLIVAIALCSSSWAEESSYDYIPTTLSLSAGNRVSYVRLENQIFDLRFSHNGRFIDQIDMDWAVLSPGVECLDDNWRAGITARYLKNPAERLLVNHPKPEPALMYFQFHHRTENLEGRIYIPLTWQVEGQRVSPWIELEHLTVLKPTRDSSVFLRGRYADQDAEIEVGFRQRVKELEIEITSGGRYFVGARITTGF